MKTLFSVLKQVEQISVLLAQLSALLVSVNNQPKNVINEITALNNTLIQNDQPIDVIHALYENKIQEQLSAEPKTGEMTLNEFINLFSTCKSPEQLFEQVKPLALALGTILCDDYVNPSYWECAHNDNITPYNAWSKLYGIVLDDRAA
jgi:hypothetical protein